MSQPYDPFEKTLSKAQRETRAKRVAERRQDDLKKVLNDAAGRRILYWLISEAGIYRSAHVPGDPYSSHVNIGKQDIGVALATEIEKAKPGVVSQMIHEHVSEQRQRKLEDEAAKKQDEEA